MNTEDEFMKYTEDFLLKQKREYFKENMKAETLLEVKTNLNSSLTKLIESNSQKNIYIIDKQMLTSKNEEYDLRMFLDEEMKQKLITKGYLYCEQESTAERLIFKKDDETY